MLRFRPQEAGGMSWIFGTYLTLKWNFREKITYARVRESPVSRKSTQTKNVLVKNTSKNPVFLWNGTILEMTLNLTHKSLSRASLKNMPLGKRQFVRFYI